MDIDKKARARVFSPEMVGKVAKASLSTYEGKDQDDKAKWSSWWARFVGPKAKKASRMEDGTQIILKKAKIENVYDKKEKKAYYTVTVFDWDYYQEDDEEDI